MVCNNTTRGFQAPDWFEAVQAARGRLSEELNRLEQSTLASEIIDLRRLRRLVDRLPAAQNDGRALLDYRGILETGITMGRFLAWVESGK